MNDVDAMLARLRESPVHTDLSNIEAGVFDQLAVMTAAPPPLSGAVFTLAGVMALVIGIAGSAFPNMPENTAPLLPFGEPPALAPSTLLGVGK